MTWQLHQYRFTDWQVYEAMIVRDAALPIIYLAKCNQEMKIRKVAMPKKDEYLH